MIVPMKKVSLMIPGNEKSAALKKLRKLGIVHIEITEGTGEKLNKLKENVSLLENAIYTIGKNKNAVQKELSCADALKLAEEIVSKSQCIKEYIARRAVLIAELDRLKDWGEVDPHAFAQLEQNGVELLLYEMPKAEYKALDDDIVTLCIESGKHSVKFALVKQGAEDEARVISALNAYRVELPASSTQDIRKNIEELEKSIKETQEAIDSYADSIESLKKAVAACQKDIELETYATGMEQQSLGDDAQRAFSIAYFTGYIEATELEQLKQTARENAWGLTAEDPCEEDNVPTKLKNNRFVSLIYPLTDFLGTVPGYFEYDISGWFLSFILIFFGIIFGDGLYGLLICAVAAVPIIRSLVTKKPVAPAFLLVGLFGLSTVLWGLFTCTWCGLPAEQLPKWLQSISIPFISNVYADKIWYPFWTNGEAGLTTAQNLQIFCFSLALVQLTVAHIKGARRNKGSAKMLSDIGSILQLVGIYYLVLSLVVNPTVFSFGLVIGGIPVGTVAIVLIAVGFVTSFVFANYEGSIVRSILASLTNIVSVLLGVVNVFSDIVSYIRLWAVGLAGAAISATVNELAGPLFGNFMFMILAIILLVFGHGLNMILNVLSVIVHGIRLNTLEFSSHLDMSWSGHKFKPFNEKGE